MKRTLLNDVITDPKEIKLRQVLQQIKPGYFITKLELANELGCKERVIEKWMRRWQWMRKYLAYIRINGAAQRSGVFLNPKYKAQLIKKGLVSEHY